VSQPCRDLETLKGGRRKVGALEENADALKKISDNYYFAGQLRPPTTIAIHATTSFFNSS